MNICVYPGSFDPVTYGHLDVIKRAAKIFDKVIVAVLYNPNKQPMFTIEERIELLKKTTKDIGNVEIDSFSGLLINFMEERNIKVIIKGLRAVSDFEYEFQMALMNKSLLSEVETMFLMTNGEYQYLSSSIVKEVASFDGCIKDFVPKIVEEAILTKIKNK